METMKKRTSQSRHTYRPILEALEDRSVPTAVFWTGLGSDSFWSNSGNWQSNIVPSNNDDIFFPGGANRQTNTNDISNLTLGGITFQGGNYSLAGAAVTLNIGITNSSANPQNVGLSAITLGGPGTFMGGIGGSLNVLSTVNLLNFGLALDGGSNSNFLEGNISGSGSILKLGTGIWTLGGNNNYAGLTTINTGALIPDSNTAFGSTSAGTVVNNGASLIVGTGPNDTVTFAEPLTINGAGNPSFPGAIIIQNLGTSFSVTGPITLNSNSTMLSSVSSSNSITLAGVVDTRGNDLKLVGSLNTIVTGSVIGNGRIINDSFVLSGTGSILATVKISSGVLNPGIGNSAGILKTGKVTLDSGTTLQINMNGTTLGASYSQVNATGDVELLGVTLVPKLNFTPRVGDSFVVIEGTGKIVGSFLGLADGTLFTLNGQLFQIVYVTGTSGNRLEASSQVILTRVEPSTTAPVFSGIPRGVRVYVTAADAGGGPDVKVFNADTNRVLSNFFAFDMNFTGGVRVAVGDVNADGFTDIVCAAGPGGGPNITVFSGKDGSFMHSFFAYDMNFTGGVYLAVGDVNADGFADIICGADAGGGPDVTIFSGRNLQRLMSFFAYDINFTGGVRVAAGDVNGDGRADIVCGAGPGGGPNVTVFSGADGSRLLSFFAYQQTQTTGIFVSSADMDADARDDVVSGPGPNSLPKVAVFTGTTGVEQRSFFAYDMTFTGGVRVAAILRAGKTRADIVSVPGPGGGPDVRTVDGQTLQQIDDFFAYDQRFTGGLFVAGTRF